MAIINNNVSNQLIGTAGADTLDGTSTPSQ